MRNDLAMGTEAPVADAQIISAVRNQLKIRNLTATLDQSELIVSGEANVPTEFAAGLRVYVRINQERVQALSRRTVGGPLVFAKAEVHSNLLQIRITGDSEAVTALNKIWLKTGTLEGYIDEISFEIAAQYSVGIEAMAPAGLNELASKCTESVVWLMGCSEYSGWIYRSVSSCLGSEADRRDYLRYVRILDPFIYDLDRKVRIRAVTRDLCRSRSAEVGLPIALPIATASQMLEAKNHRESLQVSVLSLIKINAEVSWHANLSSQWSSQGQ